MIRIVADQDRPPIIIPSSKPVIWLVAVQTLSKHSKPLKQIAPLYILETNLELENERQKAKLTIIPKIEHILDVYSL